SSRRRPDPLTVFPSTAAWPRGRAAWSLTLAAAVTGQLEISFAGYRGAALAARKRDRPLPVVDGQAQFLVDTQGSNVEAQPGLLRLDAQRDGILHATLRAGPGLDRRNRELRGGELVGCPVRIEDCQPTLGSGPPGFVAQPVQQHVAAVR